MSDKYFTINLRAYLDKDEQTYVGEESLGDLLSDFSCPDNPDVEYFLLHNAIKFTKKRSIYHISCFSCGDSFSGWLFFSCNQTYICTGCKYQQNHG